MNDITFVRLRPVEAVRERWAVARRKEGSTVVEVEHLSDGDRDAAFAGGLLAVAGQEPRRRRHPPMLPSRTAARALVKRGVRGWQMTLVTDDNRASTIDALARTGANFFPRWPELRRRGGIDCLPPRHRIANLGVRRHGRRSARSGIRRGAGPPAAWLGHRSNRDAPRRNAAAAPRADCIARWCRHRRRS